MKYSYQVLGETYNIFSSHALGGNIASQAASEFRFLRNGWECSWPLEFVILREDGSEVGRYSVDRESEPVFYAVTEFLERNTQ